MKYLLSIITVLFLSHPIAYAQNYERIVSSTGASSSLFFSKTAGFLLSSAAGTTAITLICLGNPDLPNIDNKFKVFFQCLINVPINEIKETFTDTKSENAELVDEKSIQKEIINLYKSDLANVLLGFRAEYSNTEKVIEFVQKETGLNAFDSAVFAYNQFELVEKSL